MLTLSCEMPKCQLKRPGLRKVRPINISLSISQGRYNKVIPGKQGAWKAPNWRECYDVLILRKILLLQNFSQMKPIKISCAFQVRLMHTTRLPNKQQFLALLDQPTAYQVLVFAYVLIVNRNSYTVPISHSCCILFHLKKKSSLLL